MNNKGLTSNITEFQLQLYQSFGANADLNLNVQRFLSVLEERFEAQCFLFKNEKAGKLKLISHAESKYKNTQVDLLLSSNSYPIFLTTFL